MDLLLANRIAHRSGGFYPLVVLSNESGDTHCVYPRLVERLASIGSVVATPNYTNMDALP